MTDPPSGHTTMPSKASGLLYGLGLGGFVDGIVFHRILQWHHMVSHIEEYPVATVAGLEGEHAGRWLLPCGDVVSGDGGLGRRAHGMAQGPPGAELVIPPRSGPDRVGIFNLLEGLIDHQILGVHHVRDDLGAPPSWDTLSWRSASS